MTDYSKKDKDFFIGHSRSPLRYPGGKTRAVDQLLQYFPSGLQRVCSPFLGRASLEITLAARGITVFGYDNFQPLVDFWQVLLENPNRLVRSVRRLFPLDKESFSALQRALPTMLSKYERATAFYVLNRASFSGTTLSGGMAIGHPRFTLKSISNLKDFRVKNLFVDKMDFKDSIRKHGSDFLYLDPPYFNSGRLYGVRGNMHRGFDHVGLARILHSRGNWILSYNDCPEVRALYSGFSIVPLQWPYGMNNSKRSNEILILASDYRRH